MARISRLVVPGYPHHITQRGVRSMVIFDHDDDRLAYLDFMQQEARRFGVNFIAWCLMSNQVHLIAVPSAPDKLGTLPSFYLSKKVLQQKTARSVPTDTDGHQHTKISRKSTF